MQIQDIIVSIDTSLLIFNTNLCIIRLNLLFYMSSYYNQDYTHKEIDILLSKIKSCIKNDRYILSLNKNRQENIDFINNYNIHTKKQKSILMKIKTEDFCYSIHNAKIGYEYEILYVFVPEIELINIDGIKETIAIYIKFNVIDLPSESKTVIISFHKKNKPINYLFR